MEKQDKEFLKQLSDKTFYWQDDILQPNMNEKPFNGKSAEFKKYRIPKADFRKVLTIIAKEPLFVRPKTSLPGYIEGYWVYDVNMITKEKKLVLLFGEENIPRAYTVKNLFDLLCHSKTNREIIQILPREQPIKSEFEEYRY